MSSGGRILDALSEAFTAAQGRESHAPKRLEAFERFSAFMDDKCSPTITPLPRRQRHRHALISF
jgi:hypothetical protein